MAFQVGDEVRVVRKIEGFTNGWKDSWVDSMYNCIGQVYTISRIADGNRHYLAGSGWNFPAEALEYATPREQPKEDVKMELTEEQAELLHQKAESGDKLTFAEYRWFVNNDFDRAVDDYVCPEDSDDYYHTDDLFYCEVGDKWYTDDDDFEIYHDRRGHQGRAHHLSHLGRHSCIEARRA